MGRSATVFGLDVRAEADLPFLSTSAVEPTGRGVQLVLEGTRGSSPGWPPCAEIVCDQYEPGGAVNFRIEADPDAGFRIWGPRYGEHFLALDGSRVVCVPRGAPGPTWQRLLIAQALPFAAVLQGLEVLHASAVSTPRGAIALVGVSGAGKSSVAIELCRAGAEFLADDVLALERVDDDLLAHPGTSVAGLAIEYARRLRQDEAASDPIEEVLASNAREHLVRVRAAQAPARLAALFLLERRADAPAETRFEPAADARALLSATFNSVLTDGERLRRLLDVCSIAARAQVERVLVGRRTRPAQLARAIAERVSAAR